jgi:NAD(P) transhydrogenase alpha subunit
MELLPRITRAQSMDVLSSQANLAGYRAVIEGANAFDRGFAMMMTAAGTVPPARVFVIGAGVAGLQAIATARRLGAIVSATDVRPAAKEEIKSLGASFVGVEDEETAKQTGAYAREMTAEFRKKQAELMAATIAKNDLVICTALVQGGKAPVLVTNAMVAAMKPGSVIVDLASDGGGNCEATKPGELVITANGVKVLGYLNWPSRLPVAASALYARNLLTFLTTFWDKEAKAPKLPPEDDIIKGVTLTRGGVVVHANFVGAAAGADGNAELTVKEPARDAAAAESSQAGSPLEGAGPGEVRLEPAADESGPAKPPKPAVSATTKPESTAKATKPAGSAKPAKTTEAKPAKTDKGATSAAPKSPSSSDPATTTSDEPGKQS